MSRATSDLPRLRSGSTPAARPARLSRAAGFTLIEVMVALGIFVLVTAAVVPMVIVSLRAAGTARDVTQAKGVAQSKLEQMRNMPYFVGRAAGDYIDVLDTYYRNTVAPTTTPTGCGTNTLTALPPTTWTGYVASGDTHCAWEPSGPLYRKVINPVQAPGLGAFAVMVDTQFLTSNTPPAPVPPLPGYDSQTAGQDGPATSQLGVTVAVFYKTQSGVRLTTTYTQIARSAPMSPLIESAAKSSTLAISSTQPDGANESAQIGVVNLDGERFTGSRVVATATSGTAGSSLGQQVTAAAVNLIAPTDVPATSVNSPAATSYCTYVCYGSSTVDQASARASNGLPLAGTPAAPIRAMIPNGTNYNGFQFTNQPSGTRLKFDSTQPLVLLDTSSAGSMPGVTNCQVTNTGVPSNPAYLTGTGYLDAGADTNPYVTSCATAQTGTVELFPTTFAPNGVVRVTLSRATAYCTVGRNPDFSPAPSATAAYQATVQYWNGSGYTTVPVLQQTNGSDPLAAVNLSQTISPDGLTLGDYISSWGSVTSAKSLTTSGGNDASVDLPGAVNITTQPTRENVAGGVGPYSADPTSVINLTFGAVSCKAGDYR